MIVFQCPHCFTDLKARDELAGKKIKCRSCGKAVRVDADPPSEDEEFAAPRGARLPPRRKSPARLPRPAKVAAAANPALSLALKWGPFAIAAAVLITMFVVASSNKPFRDIAMFVTLAIGGLNWVVAYFWGISIAARYDSLANVGYLIPRVGMRYITAHREHMGGPFRLLLIGLAFFAMMAVFGWIDHKQAGY
jgi:hypothetical protein